MAKRSKVAQEAFELAEPVVAGLGFDLVDCSYVKEARGMVLTLYIDKKGGIGIDDCALQIIGRIVVYHLPFRRGASQTQHIPGYEFVVLTLEFQIVYGRDSLDRIVQRISVVVLSEIYRNQCRMPIVAMDDVRIEVLPYVSDGLEDRL